MSATTSPLCTVCIANYNGEQMLVDCIESVLAQHGVPVEIIVHDDASTDASIATLAERFPGVKVIESANNVGFCIANNRMAQEARGTYLLLLNNDAALHPEALRALVVEAERETKPSILTLPQYSWDDGALINRGCLLDPGYHTVPNLDPDRSEVAMVEGACLFLPRELWNEIGGFPDWFGSIAEDTYLCCAARLLGASVRTTLTSGYRHRQGASFGGNRVRGGVLRTRYRRRYLSERNRIWVLAICSPRWLVWPWLTLHLATLLAEALAACALQASWRPWRAIYASALADAFAGRMLVRSHRNQLQSKRRISLLSYLRRFTALPQKLVVLLRYGFPRLQA